MLQFLLILWRDQDGQDLIEYTLLLTFILIITAGVIGIGGNSIKGIVNTSNSQIAYGNRYAQGG